jgi:hypothetical protein
MSRLASLAKSPLVRQGVSLLVGAAVGLFLHYLLFRLTLPVQPFIYVNF